MREAVIVSTARTPLTKAHRGEFNITPGPTLAAFAVRAAVERAGMSSLNEGDRLQFELEVDRRGKYAAVNLQQGS